MSGGVGNLQSSLDAVDRRIKAEEQKVEKMTAVGNKFAEFLIKAGATDAKVALKVRVNTLQFYAVNPWARPKTALDLLREGASKAWNWLCQKGKEVVEGLKKFAEKIAKGVKAVVDTVCKVVGAIVNFCKEHWKSIVKIVIGAAVIITLSVLSGGTAAAPLIGLALKGAVISSVTSAVLGGSMKVYQHVKETGSFDGAFGVFFDGAADGFMEGAITGALTGGVGGVGANAVRNGMSVGKAVVKHIIAGGIASAIGSGSSKVLSHVIDNGTLKGAGKVFVKEAAFGFLSGVVSTGLSVGLDRLKFNAYTKIQSKIDAGNANLIEKTFAQSKYTYKGFESTLHNGHWTATSGEGWAAYKGTMKVLDSHFTTKTVMKKLGGKLYQKIPVLFDKDTPYKLPKPSELIQTTADNFISSLKSGAAVPIMAGGR